MTSPHQLPGPWSDIEGWFSPQRMGTFAQHSSDAEQLYIWNAHTSKAFLVDIQHVEVALRNVIDRALSSNYGVEWFDYSNHHENFPINFSAQAKKSIRKAIQRAQWAQGAPTGKVIAELTFDFWYYLLSTSYQASVWPKVRGELDGNPSRQQFQGKVMTLYDFRNRASHHEPIIRPSVADETAYLDEVAESVSQVAYWIAPGCPHWIRGQSTVSHWRSRRPT